MESILIAASGALAAYALIRRLTRPGKCLCHGENNGRGENSDGNACSPCGTCPECSRCPGCSPSVARSRRHLS